MVRRRTFSAALLSGAFMGKVQAAGYPQRPITMVYNFGAGGPGDAMARYLAQEMGPLLGETVVVENRLGGGGSIGIMSAARARPDGYTILCAAVPGVVQVPMLNSKSDFDPMRSLEPIARVAVTVLGLFAHPSVDATDIPSLIAWSKQQPKGVFICGAGLINEVAASALAFDTKMHMTYVPFTGPPQALQAVLAGDVLLYMGTPSATTAQLGAQGKLKPLGVSSAEPSPLLPGVQPISKSVAGYVQDAHMAIWAPAGLPADVREALASALKTVLARPATTAYFLNNGFDAKWGGPGDVTQVALRDQHAIRELLVAKGIVYN